MFRGVRRAGFSPTFGRDRCPAKQRQKPFFRIQPIPLLRAEPPCIDDEHALVGQRVAREVGEAEFDLVGEIWAVSDIEAKLAGRRDFVDVLPPRA